MYYICPQNICYAMISSDYLVENYIRSPLLSREQRTLCPSNGKGNKTYRNVRRCRTENLCKCKKNCATFIVFHTQA